MQFVRLMCGFLLLGSLVAGGWVNPPALAQDAAEDEADREPEGPIALQFQAYHVLAPGDHLRVNLYAHRDGEFEVVVDAEGEVTLKEIGRVEIGGMRIDQAEKLLEERFAEFYKQPYVDMTLLHIGQQEVLVIGGKVEGNRTSQLIDIENGTTLFDVLVEVNPNPNTSRRTQVIRGQFEKFEMFAQLSAQTSGTDATSSYLLEHNADLLDNSAAAPAGMSEMINLIDWLEELTQQPDVLTFDVDAARLFVQGEMPRYNIGLQHGDIVFLQAPERSIRIEGSSTAGEFELLPGETLIDLLVLAGFVDDSRADLRNVVVDRSQDGVIKRAVFDLKPAGSDAAYLHDIELEDHDVIRIVQQIQHVFVMGEVNRPGVINYRQNWTVFDYLTQAGGWTAAGHEKFIAIIHHPRDMHTPCLESDMCLVNWPKFYLESVPTEYLIMPGDVIYVPPKGEKVTFSTVTSAINTLFLGLNFFDSLNDSSTTRPEPEPDPTDESTSQVSEPTSAP